MNIFLTLDYELFLGKETGSVENCIIKPINHLNIILNRHRLKCTIFVDAAYLYRINELKYHSVSLMNDYERIIQNLDILIRSGHDIQLHIHPQWINAFYKNDKWSLPDNAYSLGNFNFNTAKNIFKETKSFLENIIGKKIIAFRAGGYTLQNFDYMSIFSENDIRIDSSMKPYSKVESNNQYYDYLKPPSLNRYFFNENILFKTINGIIELPITSHKINPIDVIHSKINKYLNYDNNNVFYGDGIGSLNPTKRNFYNQVKQIFSYYVLADIDFHTYSWLEYLYLNHIKCGYEDFTIIGHPKNFSNESLLSFEDFIIKYNKLCKYQVVSQIVN